MRGTTSSEIPDVSNTDPEYRGNTIQGHTTTQKLHNSTIPRMAGNAIAIGGLQKLPTENIHQLLRILPSQNGYQPVMGWQRLRDIQNHLAAAAAFGIRTRQLTNQG
ncbi:hypothetical protein XFFB_10895 [Xylella fastidiosa]|nr:hypothetical protein XFFB_10895 [Xylella fastidiosa]